MREATLPASAGTAAARGSGSDAAREAGRPRIPRRPNLSRLARARAPASVAALFASGELPKLGLPSDAEAAAAADKDAAQALTPEARLVQRITMGAHVGERALVEEIGYYAYLERQLDFESIDDDPLEEVLDRFLPTLSMSPAELAFNYYEHPEVPIFELWTATILRSLYSPRQLFERMVIFWSDHFSIDILSNFGWFLKPIDHRDVVRRHALGSFPELLAASAHSPAMLAYLTNITNHKERPNENYSRELMELHTLGADNGYTQEDVREVARCFTGWTIWGEEAGAAFGTFRFARRIHDTDPKLVLGHALPGGRGIEDGEDVVAILAAHPATATLVARKLLRYLWGYEPPERWVEQVAAVYLDTGGDVRSMLRAVLKRRWIARATPKFKRPYHQIVSAVRAMLAEVSEPRYLLFELFKQGHLPFAWGPPNGYPDSREYWSGWLLHRWNFASAVVYPEASGVSATLPFLNPAAWPDILVKRLDWLLLGGAMSAETHDILRAHLRAGRSPQRIREALGLALAAPEFQDY